MDVSYTFDKDDSELVLMMTDGVSSEKQMRILQLARHRVMKQQIYGILLFAFSGNVVVILKIYTHEQYPTWHILHKESSAVTFLDPLVLYLCSGDLIGLRLLIFLQFLRILHLLPFCLVQVALPVHKYCCLLLTNSFLIIWNLLLRACFLEIGQVVHFRIEMIASRLIWLP